MKCEFICGFFRFYIAIRKLCEIITSFTRLKKTLELAETESRLFFERMWNVEPNNIAYLNVSYKIVRHLIGLS